jgi:hypothetical protein
MQQACGDLSQYVLLTSIDEVVLELGGVTAVSRLTERSRTAVCNWRAAGLFPASFFPRMQKALHKRGCKVDMRLFTFAPEEPDGERAASPIVGEVA